MKLRLSYIGINTDGPVPILTLENGMTVEATYDMLDVAAEECEKMTNACDSALLLKSRSTIDPDKLEQ